MILVLAGVGTSTRSVVCLSLPLARLFPILGSRFRFESGSYGGSGRGFMPSALCYQRTSAEQWVEHFCLVNPTCHVTTEEEASAAAQRDLDGAFAVKAQGGSDREVAEFLRSR